MEEFGINTPRRTRHFLAQIAHETGELRWMREIASGEAYEGREDLGNTVEGDGPRFRGWGIPHITGRKNTRLASLALYGDERLVDEPSLIDPPSTELSCRAGGYFWKTGAGLNLSKRAIAYGVPIGCDLGEFADRDDLEGITLAWNGGLNGFAERERYLGMAAALVPNVA
jgi:putative chitinase